MDTHDHLHEEEFGPEPYLLRVSAPVLVLLNALAHVLLAFVIIQAAQLLHHTVNTTQVVQCAAILLVCNLCWQLIMRYKIEHDDEHHH